MNTYFIVIAIYNDYRNYLFNTYISPRNKLYCEKQGYKYIEITDIKDINVIRNEITWSKFKVIKDLIDNNTLKDNDIVVHLDADAWIVDITKPLATIKSFAYAIDSGNSHCMGMYSLKVNSWTKRMLDLILDEDRYQKLSKKLSMHNNSMSSFQLEFREQASWYYLAGIKRHSWIPFWNLPNFGWHSNKNEFTIYSLQELYRNVQLFPTQYNVTLVTNECTSKYHILDTKREDVIIRHFAGGINNWRKDWMQEPPRIVNEVTFFKE